MKNIRNEEAVSPVIAVVLLVVITVILAAIIAVFAFGIGSPEKTPQAKLKFTAMNSSLPNNSTLTVRHTGGDPLKLENVDWYSDGVRIGNMSGTCTPSAGLFVNGVTVCKGTAANAWNPLANSVVKITVLHVPSGQNIADVEVAVIAP